MRWHFLGGPVSVTSVLHSGVLDNFERLFEQYSVAMRSSISYYYAWTAPIDTMSGNTCRYSPVLWAFDLEFSLWTAAVQIRQVSRIMVALSDFIFHNRNIFPYRTSRIFVVGSGRPRVYLILHGWSFWCKQKHTMNKWKRYLSEAIWLPYCVSNLWLAVDHSL